MSGKSVRSKAIRKLDTIFSKYIRRRDCGYGYAPCISCGKLITYDTSDCGHYENRKHMATRYDEKNCNAQCRACNRFSEGNIQGYRRGLIKKYGESEVEKIEIRRYNISKLSVPEIEILSKHYKGKLTNLENTLKQEASCSKR